MPERKPPARLLQISLSAFFLVAGVGGFWLGYRQVTQETLLVITWHGVVDKPQQPWEISQATLAQQLAQLAEFGYEPLQPEQFERWWQGEIHGGRRFLISFDDGLKSSMHAMEKLRLERGLRSVLFVVAGDIGKPDYITASDALALAQAGHRIESHAWRHLPLPQLASSGVNVVAELVRSRDVLASYTGRPPTWFAYPYGDFDAPSRAAVAGASFSYAFTIGGTAVSRTGDALLVPRLMYLAGAIEMNEPDLTQWLPPPTTRQGGLTLTLAAFLTILAMHQLARMRRRN